MEQSFLGYWTGLGQSMAGLVFIWAMAKQFLPEDFHQYFTKHTRKIWGYFRPYIDVTFWEYSREQFRRNELYTHIQTYLSATTSNSAKRFTGDMRKKSSSVVLSLDEHEEVTDDFRGVRFWWASRKDVPSGNFISWYPGEEDRRYFMVTFHRSHRAVFDEYLKHVMEEGKAIEVKNRQRKLFTNRSGGQDGGGLWSHVVFEHPATFEAIALHPDKKSAIIDDLDSFKNGKEFYARIGKAWKRGYLLFGPPGTGKSTMIAAMANHLDYDVYDLELTAVKDNTELRKLLIETTAKSIIVIEDIDCSQDLSGKREGKKKDQEDDSTAPEDEPPKKKKNDKKKEGSQVTLSGLLNFIDGLWSTSCGGERIIVFTTNHKEKLDPALMRRGRMDLHIEMSYCCFEAFKVLAKNYLLLDDHPLFEKVREMLDQVDGVKITPADVAENLMPKRPSKVSDFDTAGMCIKNLIQALEDAKIREDAGDNEVVGPQAGESVERAIKHRLVRVVCGPPGSIMLEEWMARFDFTAEDKINARREFYKNGSDHMRSIMHKARKEALRKCKSNSIASCIEIGRPTWLNQDVWRSLVVDHCLKDGFVVKSAKGRANRMSLVNDTPSKHNAGSVSFVVTGKRLSKEKNRDVQFSEVFEKTHDISPVGSAYGGAMGAYKGAMRVKYGEDMTAWPHNDNDVYLETMGPPKKGRYLGLGCSTSLVPLASQMGSSSYQCASSHDISGRDDEMQSLRRRVEAMEQNMLTSHAVETQFKSFETRLDERDKQLEDRMMAAIHMAFDQRMGPRQ